MIRLVTSGRLREMCISDSMNDKDFECGTEISDDIDFFEIFLTK